LTLVDGSNLDVWLFDLGRRVLAQRLTTHPGEDFGAVWHPDGRELALGSEVSGEEEGPTVALIRALGSPPESLTRTSGFGNWEVPASFSPDGHWLAYVATRGRADNDILMLAPFDAGEPTELVATPADERAPMISPDGQWLAYVSDETGRDQVYVAPFNRPGERTSISTRGGREPLWSRDGRELFYREGSHLMRARVDGSGDRFVAAEGEILFEDVRSGEWTGFGADTANYDVSPDGKRFLMTRRKDPITATMIDIVLNWPQTLGVATADRR
jgi:Tol biopolymer transport system component